MRYLYHDIWGRAKGDFNPDQVQYSNDNFEHFTDRQRKRESLNLIFAPSCNFTTKIVTLGEDDLDVNDWLVRTKSPADGGIIEEPGQAVAIFNGDCPIVALFDPDKGRLAVLHAGFRCLVPDTKNPRSIIKVAFDDHGFDPKETKVFFGLGIGPCCYGAEHWREVQHTMLGINLPLGRATRGLASRPKGRNGERSIDLYQLILDQLGKAGVPETNILREMTCTSCAKDDINGFVDFSFHSHCRGDKGRNASMAWYAEEDDSLRNMFGTTTPHRDQND